MEAEAEGYLVCFQTLPQLQNIVLSKPDPFRLRPHLVALVFVHVFGDRLENDVAAVVSKFQRR